VGVEDVRQVEDVLDGVSFADLLRGEPRIDRSERPLFWHFPNHWGPKGPGIGPSSSIRLGDWKLIHYYEPGRKAELFHLGEDLGERDNRAASHPEVADRLRERLRAHLREVDAQFPRLRETGELLTP